MKEWKSYTDRNPKTPEEMDALCLKLYGVTRTHMNQAYLGSLPRDMRILEVGCGSGANLMGLQQMGFNDLWGADTEYSALRIAGLNGVIISLSDARDLKLNTNWFDLVFTSGLLIHIPPDDLPQVMDEMYRVSKKYIWGLEYYWPELVDIPEYEAKYGIKCWKGDYGKMFEERYPLKSVSTFFKYEDSDNRDKMYFLEKSEGAK